MLQEGLTEEQARSRFYMVDKQGLLFDDDPELTPEQKPFARKRSEFANADELTTLEELL
ncbi:malic enzyme-like NAD(P)-binding protein [Latilactobacillus sakei]